MMRVRCFALAAILTASASPLPAQGRSPDRRWTISWSYLALEGGRVTSNYSWPVGEYHGGNVLRGGYAGWTASVKDAMQEAGLDHPRFPGDCDTARGHPPYPCESSYPERRGPKILATTVALGRQLRRPLGLRVMWGRKDLGAVTGHRFEGAIGWDPETYVRNTAALTTVAALAEWRFREPFNAPVTIRFAAGPASHTVKLQYRTTRYASASNSGWTPWQDSISTLKKPDTFSKPASAFGRGAARSSSMPCSTVASGNSRSDRIRARLAGAHRSARPRSPSPSGSGSETRLPSLVRVSLSTKRGSVY